ncbi:putative quinol monooxygenase [Clostridium omnivorum]|uniref:ABM domain-containing protein n=1 Tax=Clostridium omnivorum TaxID=1604902 RepID=A0ABQ5N9J6_9CLOT|nr:putative quinol monooxygenase [Clostridium sp. E14]GLC31886.1 hypothetical protein bsdE14_32960 [Clostridium sp. E14]
MITIVAKSEIKEGKVEEFIALAEKLINESRKEAGCISYYLNQDINNSNVLTFMEEWESKEAIALHNNSEHYKTIVPMLGKFRVSSPDVTLYERIK